MDSDFVYRVMRNSDSTEGRGPMVYVTTFRSFEAANAYITSKGFPYKEKILPVREGNRWNYGGWYTIHRDEVLDYYDAEQIKKDKQELEELEKRVETLRNKIKL